MSSPCTVPRLVRCRVRDLASCFYACRLPLDEEPADTFCSKPTQMSSNGNTTFDSKVSSRAHKAREKKLSRKDGEESVQILSRNISKTGRVAENGNRPVEPRFAEEDYIVFCFREDGEIDMINDGNNKPSEAYDQHAKIVTTATLRPVNRKKVSRFSIGQGDEKGSKEKGNEWPPDNELKETNTNEQPNSSKMDSFESCDSNLSDTSTSSFAFPVLGIEWIGSPVHMPKSEKPEARSLRLHCCRF
ncbi:hypothetical protein DH2020_016694 [Rehmannia glutinosa]|uniref:Protein BREAKING OF ASYMMETRY IN THE STOMATAL LINEAGE n=1 Tax=Rehmannia glutinosa TaxID=99300 RepID=A0ABR0WPU9_REHGL